MDEPGGEAAARLGSPVAPSAREIVVVSDLHLAGHRAITDGFDRSAALAGFLRSLTGRSDAGETVLLVILGDAFDLPQSAPPGTACRDAGHRWEAGPATRWSGCSTCTPTWSTGWPRSSSPAGGSRSSRATTMRRSPRPPSDCRSSSGSASRRPEPRPSTPGFCTGRGCSTPSTASSITT